MQVLLKRDNGRFANNAFTCTNARSFKSSYIYNCVCSVRNLLMRIRRLLMCIRRFLMCIRSLRMITVKVFLD